MPPLSPEVKGKLYTDFSSRVWWFFNHHTLNHSTIGYHVVSRTTLHYKTLWNMGRGAYDTTYVGSDKDSAAAVAIAMHSIKAAEAAKIAAIEAAEAAEAKLIKSKKSRGILAARRAAKEQDAAQADTYVSEGDSDATEKP